jgi:flavin reductase (DIM6/NTAB) family NADH-FMN oxidoreductase RutF
MQRPWNRPNYPVWSLSTVDDNDGMYNMNICTYVTAISMKPKQFCIAVYHGTKTHANIKRSKTAILQLLGEHQSDVVRNLGKMSGFLRKKVSIVNKKHPIITTQGLAVMSDSLSYCLIEFDEMVVTGGDHDLIIGNVISYKNLNEGKVLTTQKLSELKIISV